LDAVDGTGPWSSAELGGDSRARPDACPDWVRRAYGEFHARLTDGDDYPCHFGVQAQRSGHNRFAAVARDPGRADAEALGRALLSYAERSRSGPRRQSFVVFAGPPPPEDASGPGGDDDACFWRILSALSSVDPAPWPAGYSQDTKDPDWQWCFGGQPWFVFAGSPTNSVRRSRNFGGCLALVFQTMRVFEGLLDSKRSWHAAKDRIRASLERYDTLPIHPHFGALTDEASYRWRYAVLPDDQRVAPAEGCPFQHAPGAGRI
jgi:uncharacterized protein